ncbi:alpha-L-fucosidase [Pelagicoccus sp. SDUM812003]|uniref:alpha-L-fucosidase n=1 Tax=Pelagicoccus sp. SDUM812003 TaxID=3041267 RepID=UPI00280CDF33|nr:alpha-L-fucosidase [Pelagicoccus sp. SDUM812003]MDQ8202151.1 alpha-L-fucosidase [Pelagicoccus sp. SDUM812003]
MKPCWKINTLSLLAALFAAAPLSASIPSDAEPSVIVDTSVEPVASGKFEPTWESLAQYEVPEWFRDAKFGIWAHWGPQCEPERGDWYARNMYCQDHWQYDEHLEQYGHPSTFGFKDIINEWKAENWDPDKLMELYQRVGAKYFFALANHHDNLDLWNSKYQPWNSVNMGPKKDLIAGWATAAREHGMKFGVSVHAAHAWGWYETAQGADQTGPLAGVPYDGDLTKEDGKGTWWEGYDPQDLYEQRHEPAPGFEEPTSIWGRWEWGNGLTPPDQDFCDRFYNRTVDLIDSYHPDLIYFDDTALPLWPVSDAGLKLAAHFYNRRNQWRGDDGVLFGKVLDPDQRQCMVWDIERGRSHKIEPEPWQSGTCLGDWHYNKGVYENNGYKSARTIVHTLVDVVSKNGNLLLSVPLRGDGAPDDAEIAILEGIAAWMQINQEAIHGTRPWKVMGEGPQMEATEADDRPKFNEDKVKPFTAEDVRFTTKGDTLYATLMSVPSVDISIESLGTAAGLYDGEIGHVTLLGSDEELAWSQTSRALVIEAPKKVPSDIAIVFKISPRD